MLAIGTSLNIHYLDPLGHGPWLVLGVRVLDSRLVVICCWAVQDLPALQLAEPSVPSPSHVSQPKPPINDCENWGKRKAPRLFLPEDPQLRYGRAPEAMRLKSKRRALLRARLR